MMHGTNRPPFTVKFDPYPDIQDVSNHDFKPRGCTGCQPGTCGQSCSSCAPSCGRSGPKIDVSLSGKTPPNVSDRPFGLPADSIEIVLDLPMPPSINRLWKHGRGRVYKSDEYLKWTANADIAFVLARSELRKQPDPVANWQKIKGPFEMHVLLNEKMSKADGDNVSFKALLDWLQSRNIIRNDKDSRRWSGEWVEAERAPKGCRVILRSLHAPDIVVR